PRLSRDPRDPGVSGGRGGPCLGVDGHRPAARDDPRRRRALSCGRMTDRPKSEAEAAVIAAWGSPGGAWAILVHGGAGAVSPESVPARIEGCRRAASEGARVLAGGGSALDAAQRAIEVLEDDPLFNAGTGACLTTDGA